jgi:hypothetical protein
MRIERQAYAGPSMFRFLFRFAGLVVITLSFLFVVYDGTKSIADQTTYISRVGPTWVNIHPNSLSAFEPAVETLAGRWVWDDVVRPYLLEQPTELVLVIIGALLVLLGSKKKPRGPRYARRDSLLDA